MESIDKLSTEDRTGEEDPLLIAQGKEDEQAKRDVMSAQMDRFLTFDDLESEEDDLDLSSLMTQKQHPFYNYNSRVIRQRIYPKNPALDYADAAELEEYCRLRDYFHPQKMVVRTIQDPDNERRRIKQIVKNTLKKNELRDWIEQCETLTFPTVAVVFCRTRRKPKVPHSRALKSYIDNQFYDTVFDKEWVLPSGKKRPGWFAIVQDHTLRAQLLFRFNPKRRGRLIIDKRYSFLKEDNRQIELLREVFLICQKTRRVIQESGIASSGDVAEKELFGDQLPAYQEM